MAKLLSREEFKKQVFQRNNAKCVFCGAPAVDAHHILDRKLFPDGGYYLDNGAAVCESDHWKCEATEYSVEQVREASGITEVVVPTGFDPMLEYDKWGNLVLESGRRRAGPLMNDDGCRKILKNKLWLFD